MRVAIYHNDEARFAPYQDGQHLELVLSYHLPDTDQHRNLLAVAEDAFECFNADLEVLQPRRGVGDGEVLFLAACVYRLLGLRSLSVGDVLHLTPSASGTSEVWLACDRRGWRPVTEPQSRSGEPGTAAAVYDRLAALRGSK